MVYLMVEDLSAHNHITWVMGQLQATTQDLFKILHSETTMLVTLMNFYTIHG